MCLYDSSTAKYLISIAERIVENTSSSSVSVNIAEQAIVTQAITELSSVLINRYVTDELSYAAFFL